MRRLAIILVLVACVFPGTPAAQDSILTPPSEPLSDPSPPRSPVSTEETSSSAEPSTAVTAIEAVRPLRSDSGSPWLAWTRATGDWNGGRRALDRRGVALDATLTSDVSFVHASRAGDGALGRALIDASTTLDLDALVGLRSMTVFVRHLSFVGTNGSDRTVDHQGFSNIDATPFSRITELWVEQAFAAGRLRLKAGRIDANTEFAAVDAASLFLNSSMGFSPTILLFPTYPNPRPGAVVAVQPWAHGGVSAAVYDGADDDCHLVSQAEEGVFAIGEAWVRWRLGARALAGRGSLGVWHHSGKLRLFDGEFSRGIASPFGTVEQTLWQAATDDDAPRVRAFLQAGTASDLALAIVRHAGGGVVAERVLPGRPQDAFGLALTSVRLSHKTPASEEDGVETAFAAFYRYHLARWLALQPDVQYVVHAAGRVPRHTALLATVRLQVEF